MRILFAVDQKEALRRGIDAPSSTVQLEVNPAELPQEHRDLIAMILKDGHDATGSVWSPERGLLGQLKLPTPDLDGLTEVLNKWIEEKQKRDAEEAEIAEKNRRRADEQVRAKLDMPSETVRYTVKLNEHGHEVNHAFKAAVVRTIDVPDIPNVSPWEGQYISPSIRAEVDRVTRDIEQTRERLIAETVAEMQAHDLPQWLAKQEAEKADYESLVARLPQGLRERREAGYASDEEWDAALQDLILTDLGVDQDDRIESHGEEYGWDFDRELTDDEFEALKRWREKLGDRADISPYRAIQTRQDEYDYGDTVEVDVDAGKVGRIETERAGITARCHVWLA